jgi:hypothetical protein
MENAGPAIVATDSSVYIAFPAFNLYAEYGQIALRDIVMSALKRLLPKLTLTTSLPSQGIQTVQRQDAHRRTIVHLLYATPIKHGANIEVIEDLVPLHDIEVALRTPSRPTRVSLAPGGGDLQFTYEDGVARTTVPTVYCHQMVVFED